MTVEDRGDTITTADLNKEDQQAAEAAAAEAAEKAAVEAAAAAAKKEEEEEEDDPPTKRIRIPKARVDEITRKHKEREEALQRRIEELEGETAKSKMSADFNALREKNEELANKYEDLIADGKLAEAKAVRKELSELQLYMVNALADARATAAQREAVADVKYDILLTDLESKHGELNPDSDDFNEEIVNEVFDITNRLVATGLPKDRALGRAVKYVLGSSGKPVLDEDAKKKAAARAEEARRKALEATSKQPAALDKHGKDSDKAGGGVDTASVLRMSQDDFSKLDAATLASLRGDEL